MTVISISGVSSKNKKRETMQRESDSLSKEIILEHFPGRDFSMKKFENII